MMISGLSFCARFQSGDEDLNMVEFDWHKACHN